ncbi:PDZ domain-containing protein [Schlesneria paludicola]|uniref:PDZ domain-containing protein n=1 Tax=Schlesneria paludicola TaxID=360056 RepID=UPI00029B0216|nr:PDZ domain-containing protein [Schlesneria paludicola]
MLRLLLIIVLGLAATPAAWAAADPSPESPRLEALEEQAFKHAAAFAGPSVVRIETVGGLEQVDDVLLGNGPTSGVVVSADGYIVTSSFNFISKPASIMVTLPDGRRFAARQVANDRLRQLTLLKVDAEDLVPAIPVPRTEIKVGQWALALGRTLDNATPSISVGIVSAINRVWGKAIQTDAKTSPVNYGGALVDVEGRVLGVIAPLSPTGSGEMAGVEWYDGGIGFAIPMEETFASLEQLKQGTDLLPGLMGITFAGGQALNVPCIVDRVRYNSPAQQAGLKTNDRIIEADGERIVRVAQLKHVVGRKYAGETLKLVLQRGDQTIPTELSLVGRLIPYELPYLGILPERHQVEGPVVVRYVFKDSPAAKSGIERGDHLRAYEGADLADVQALRERIGRSRPGDVVTIRYARDGRENDVQVTLGTVPEAVVDDLPTETAAIRSAPGQDVNVPAEPAKERLAEKPKGQLPTGRFTETLAGYDHDYWAYVPETYDPSNAMGLVVWVHPKGDTMEAQIVKQWKSVCDRRGLILVAPLAEKVAAWQPGEAGFIKGLIGHMRERYTIDSSRIVVHAHSTGALMGWLLATRSRDVVRGVVVTAAPFVGQPPESEPDLRQQYFFLCGDEDKLLPRVQLSVAELRKLRLPVSFTLIKGLGPKYPVDDAIDEIGRWVDSLDRI